MRKKVLYICIVITWWLTNIASAQNYFTEGTRWIELRLDTLKYDSWFSEVYQDGVITWIPNYEEVYFYVEGDTTSVSGQHYNMVWRDTKDIKHLHSFLLGENSQKELILSMFSYGGIFSPCRVYDFEDWKTGKELYFESFSWDHLITGIFKPQKYGTIEEVKTGNFGGTRNLEYININSTWTGEAKLIRGIGVTCSNSRDCIFCQSGCEEIEASYYESLKEYHEESPKKQHRSILVHFERDGEVLYDLWPTPEGGLASHIQSPKVNRADDTSVYDLQGRKIQGKPSRGIYIIGGKKRVVE